MNLVKDTTGFPDSSVDKESTCNARVQFSSVQLLSYVLPFVTPWTAARQAFLYITNSRSLLKLTSIESVMPSNHFILCCPLLLPPSIFNPNPGIQPGSLMSPALAGGFFTISTTWETPLIVLPLSDYFRDCYSMPQSLLFCFEICLTVMFSSNLNLNLNDLYLFSRRTLFSICCCCFC